jgi:hypothetical protein
MVPPTSAVQFQVGHAQCKTYFPRIPDVRGKLGTCPIREGFQRHPNYKADEATR